MNSQKYKWNKNINFICILVLTFVLSTHCWGNEKGALSKERVEKIKKAYEFDKWAGKVKIKDRSIEKLNIDPNYFNIFSKKTIIYSKKADRNKSMNVKIIDKKTDLEVDIDIGLFKDPLAAHNSIVNYMTTISYPFPALKRIEPNDPNNPLNIGDVCFVPGYWMPEKSKKPVLRTLIFYRNNVSVFLRNTNDETKEEYPDLVDIARSIDKKLIEISEPKK